jgi:hypothetical protein
MGKPMQILTWAGGIIIGLGAVFAAASALGAWRWKGATGDLTALLDAGRSAPAIRRYDAAELAGLPAPVQRYFRAVLTDDQRIITGAMMTQAGMFNMSATADQWKPFTATQTVATRRAGFVWNATITLFPGVPVRVLDAYVAGQGTLRPSILGLYSMGDIIGDGEIARGELMRFFAEAVWYPTALLPSQGVVWDAVDAASAKATLTDGPISLTMLFRFGADDLIASIHADARGGTVDGVAVMMPWECRMSNYQTRNGMRVPLTGEVAYITAQGEKPYFRGTIQQITYQFAP